MMIRFAAFLFICFYTSCSLVAEKSPLVIRTVLPDNLKEISGISAAGKYIWAITDKPKASIYKLDSAGKLLQVVNITNADVTDVEAVASDGQFIYLGDLGDNNGDREERKIIKVSAAAIPAGQEVQTAGETIEFTFPDREIIEKKKQNNFDCESLISFRDSLYVFTKDREDKETKLYVIPKTPGKFIAKFISSFNSAGLITDAAINPNNNELALIGYHKGHLYPFIYLFSNYKGDDFFSGDHQKIELAAKPWDWQLEGITYSDKNLVYFSCEGTKQVPATFYGIKRDDIFKLKKKKDKKDDFDVDDEEGPGLTKKAHLKM